MKKLVLTLVCFALPLSSTLTALAEVKKANSQAIPDNNNAGENQSAEPVREEALTNKDTLSSENNEEVEEGFEEDNKSEENVGDSREKEQENKEDIELKSTGENENDTEEKSEENAGDSKRSKEKEQENKDLMEETVKEDIKLKLRGDNKKEYIKENKNLNKKSKKDLIPRMAIVKEMHHNGHSSEERQPSKELEPEGPAPCTCGIFLSSQFKKGSKNQPKGLPVLEQEIDTPFMNNAIGNRQCMHRCLEVIIKHLPKSNEIICATVDKDHVHREKAFLFIKNHSHKWHETKMSAGREFCCKDNLPYKCNKSKRSILSLFA